MKFHPIYPAPLARPVSQVGLLLLSLLFALSVTACSNSDVAGTNSCATSSECELGTVCIAAGVCDTVPCNFCDEDSGYICYITPENPAGSCSMPQCTLAEDCDAGQSCSGGVCRDVITCSNQGDCPSGHVCNYAGFCVADQGGDNNYCDDHSDCESDQFCDPQSEQCATAIDCSTVECGPGESCVEPYGVCFFDCNNDPSICGANEYCAANGECRSNDCPGIDPGSCSGATPIFDGDSCSCVACLGNSDCPGGRVCQGGSCQEPAGGCAHACDGTPGSCSGTGLPYCVQQCCVQCLGAADCDMGEMCVDGFCGTPPDCSTDPSVCPSGHTCNASGQCVPPQTGQDCSADPMSCPEGTFCDPDTGQCQGVGGDFGCGFCNPDCTCPNGLSCNGFACDGCQAGLGQCPADQFCMPTNFNTFPFTGMCFPDFFQ